MISLKDKHVLVTGGAGFIGSNIVAALLLQSARVTVLDNLSTGNYTNIEPFINNPLFTFVEGDICNYETCLNALNDVDAITHQAALGSVPRSIEFPHNTHLVNATGFLNMLNAAKERGVKRFVYASSSSVYGDSKVSPKTIGSEGRLLSPYAVTKQLNEMYAGVYHQLHQQETIGLRYFNVFGPNQDPNGAYAAAIPKFIDAMLNGGQITIHGDGEQTRDFTYVKNAVKANILALSTENSAAFGKSFNVACGQYYTLNQVINSIRTVLDDKRRFNAATTIVHGPERSGDIRDSLAEISDTKGVLNYTDLVYFDAGMKEYLDTII